MRVVVLCSSPYSETGCAMAAQLVQAGNIPVGALSLPAWDLETLLRKVGQWGLRDSLRFARAKIGPKQAEREQIRNPYLQKMLVHGKGTFRSLFEVSRRYKFPLTTVSDQNSAQAIEHLTRWSPDIAIFTGGNILREKTLASFRHGVLNSHLAVLPEVRGMSSPEWSVLTGVPLGITIHLMDSGIDTGRIVLRREFLKPPDCTSFTDLRNRMIASGIEWMSEAVAALEAGTVAPVPQAMAESDGGLVDRQFFVMHDRLKAVAARHFLDLSSNRGTNTPPPAGARNG